MGAITSSSRATPILFWDGCMDRDHFNLCHFMVQLTDHRGSFLPNTFAKFTTEQFGPVLMSALQRQNGWTGEDSESSVRIRKLEHWTQN